MSPTIDRPARPRAARKRAAGPTVADVARLADVSQMTVSRVVNSDRRVRPETRARVERAVATLGYVPNLAARSLAGGGAIRIALLYGNPSSAYLSEFLVGSLAGARDSNAELIVENCDGLEEAEALAGRLASQRVEAALLPPPLCEDARLLAALAASRIVVTQVATGRPAARAHSVSIGDEAAAYAITRHLLALGHRRIGFVSGDPIQSASHSRREGYLRALREAGVEPDALLQPGDFTYRAGLAAGEALLSLDRRPSAIFASNDDMAAAVLSVAHRRHLDVPAVLSICGFDDTAIATTVWPELTTIRQPIARMARRAACLLAESVLNVRDGGWPPPRHELVDYELVVRGSSGPARD